jgi:hypothetical protein
MTTTAEYLDLITDEHKQRPKFVATVTSSVAPFAKLQEVMKGFISDFDVDNAIGVQLDIVALWVGVTRRVAIPISGYYFSWDDVAADGWDNGVWKGIGDPDSGFVNLPDDLFRSLIKAKIQANHWRGDIAGAYDIINEALSVNDVVKIVDNQNMTMTVRVTSGALPAVEQAIVTAGYLPIKPAGVQAIYTLV